MKLVVKISSGNKDDLKNITLKSVKNNNIYDLTYKINSWVEIPEEILKTQYILLINISEKGGLCENKSYSQIICGINGKPLKPFFIPRKNIIPCGDHAYFSVPEQCYSIESNGNTIRIKYNFIEAKDNKARIKSDEVYNGTINDLPEEYHKLKKPANIALDKANCSNCTFAFYFMEPNLLVNSSRK